MSEPEFSYLPKLPAVRLSRPQLVLVFCLALALLTAIAAYAFAESRHESQARDKVTHTLLVLKETLELENTAIVMEANHRAYLITGQATVLARRNLGYREAQRLAGKLVLRVGDNPQQVHRLEQSIDALKIRYRNMQVTSSVAISDGLPAARARFEVLGDGSIEPMRKLLAAVRHEEQRILAERKEVSDRGLVRFHWLLIGGTSLSFLILIATGLALLRELTRAEGISQELVVANQELSLQTEQLMQSNRELESFSYSVSHDLRAPLRHIDGYARMLSEDAADQLAAESQRYLSIIISSARRMGLLIDDLLAFSRLGRKPLALQLVDMQALVASVVGEMKANCAGVIDVAVLPSVAGDPALLRQAWINLLSNAVKFSAMRGDQAQIAVTGERQDATMLYSVRDNGVGFDMRYADKLFGVFQRLHPADEFEGTGVGLAIVQRIISRHGGKISATAAVDRGACFSFELPIIEVVT